MAHKHKCLNPETWLPLWLRSRGLTVQTIRVHPKTAAPFEVVLDQNGEFDCADTRCCRHLDADPRFSRRDF